MHRRKSPEIIFGDPYDKGSFGSATQPLTPQNLRYEAVRVKECASGKTVLR